MGLGMLIGLAAMTAWPAPLGGVVALGRFEFSGAHMGTTVRVLLYAGGSEAADRAASAAMARIAELDGVLSDYRPESELSRLTETAVGRPVTVGPDLFRVLDAAQAMARRSHGAFDITVGPLSRLWRRARRQIEMPSRVELEAARAVTGYGLLALDPVTHTATLAKPGMRLDAGGIAKGYAADQALAAVRRSGVARALVAIGGDLALGAPPPGATGWQVVLAGLSTDRTAPGSPLTLAEVGVSTSGDAEQWVEIDGRRYSHIVDPLTGLGVTGHRSVSVVAGDAMTSDMLATAVNVLPIQEGTALVDGTPGAAALVGTRDGDSVSWRRSRAWRW